MRLLLLFLIINGVSIFNTALAQKKEYTEQNGAIPPEFGSDNKTVLVCIIEKRPSYDRYLKKGAENYNGEKIFITRDELETPPFNNMEIYRYVFDYDYYSYKRFFLEDRLLKIKYQSGGEFGNFGKAIFFYMENLEEKRTGRH